MTNSLSVLPFYSSLALQNHRKDYVNGQVYPLVCKAGSIPACQIYVPSNTVTITGAELKSIEGVVLQDGMPNTWSGVSVINRSTYSIIVFYPDNVSFKNSILEPCYVELSLTYSGQSHILYSEVIMPIADLSRLLSIRYLSNLNFSAKSVVLEYPENFYHKLYLHTQLGKPDYPFEEDVTKRDGYTFIEKQVSEKKYKFTFLAPEYLIDAMRIIAMHNTILITNVDGTEYEVDHFLITPKWDTVGDLASVDVEFECDTIVKTVGTIG